MGAALEVKRGVELPKRVTAKSSTHSQSPHGANRKETHDEHRATHGDGDLTESSR